jgi:DNA repair protein RecN (Recombination protein N)
VPTLIFDEVDSGVGGAVAEVVGQLLEALGQHHQVLCITHLPQVAARAQTHYQVSKAQKNGSMQSCIVKLDATTRIEEIARMLGGITITATARRHAQEMLGA